MESNIKNYKEENENLRLKLELCNRELLLKQKEHELYRLKHNVCRKRKSKFPIKFKPKILKPSEINTNEINNDFKNVPEIEDLYEEAPDKDLPKPSINDKVLTREDQVRKWYNKSKDDEVIVEPYKEPRISLIDKSPKGYIEQYKLDILSTYIENQITKNKDIIKETLLKDLKNLKGLE